MRYPRPHKHRDFGTEFTWLLLYIITAAAVLFGVWLLLVTAWAIFPQ